MSANDTNSRSHEKALRQILAQNRRMRKLLKDFYPYIGFQSGGKSGDEMFAGFKERFLKEIGA